MRKIVIILGVLALMASGCGQATKKQSEAQKMNINRPKKDIKKKNMDKIEKFNEELYLVDMYNDKYFPKFLVDKIKSLIVEGVKLLESGEQDLDIIQEKFDKIIIGINNLQDEFYENDSEIETVARESIGQTLEDIIKHFNLNVDVETLMRERDW